MIQKHQILPIGLMAMIIITFNICCMNQKQSTVVFFGDSIISLGASQLDGFISLIAGTLEARGDKKQFFIQSAGVGGSKITDLYLRLESDVLAYKPQKVFILVGINDVKDKYSWGTGIDTATFARFYIAAIKKLQKEKCTVILCTPLCFGENTVAPNPIAKDLDNYISIIRSIARSYSCELCDLHQAYERYELINNTSHLDSTILTQDGIHPNKKGNEIIASEIIKFLPRGQ